MSEQTTGHIELTDVTAQYRPGKVNKSGALDIDHVVWEEEQREELWKFTEGIYNDLAIEASDIFGVEMPEFQREMISWVQFDPRSKQKAAADHDPNSGRIRMSVSHVNEELDAIRLMAHEMVHLAALRKLLVKDDTEIPGRVGISVVGNSVASRGRNNEDFKFEKYHGAVFNEALTEIVSAEMVNRVKDKYDFIPDEGIEPVGYSNERRLYSAVVDAVVLSWNSPDLRKQLLTNEYDNGVKDHSSKMDFQPGYSERRAESWQNRIDRLKERLEWEDHIDRDQVEQLFRQALIDSSGLTKVAPLLNVCLGEQAFQELWEAQTGENNERAWKVIRPFNESEAFRKRDLSLQVDGLAIQISGDEVPENVIFDTYEEVDGTQLGIEDVFKHYEESLQSPIALNDITLYAERVHRIREKIHAEYPFNLPVVHEPAGQSIMTLRSQDTMEFCFDRLSKTVGVKDNPTNTESKEVLGTTYDTEYYECENKPEVLLAKVTIYATADRRASKRTRYFFISKT